MMHRKGIAQESTWKGLTGTNSLSPKTIAKGMEQKSCVEREL